MAAIGSLAGWWPSTISILAAALALVAIGALVTWGSADPALQLFGPAVLTGDPGHQAISLTFDDGPHPESTAGLLEALAEHEARATFFLLVDQAEAHPELARAIASRHEVGLHGLRHDPWLTLRSPDKGAQELREATAKLAAITGSAITLYRPPFGAVSPRLVASVAAAGLTLVWCSVRTRDGGRLSASTVRERCRQASAGDIVLLHEGRPSTLQAIPTILEDLATRHLGCVTVGELLEPV